MNEPIKFQHPKFKNIVKIPRIKLWIMQDQKWIGEGDSDTMIFDNYMTLLQLWSTKL